MERPKKPYHITMKITQQAIDSIADKRRFIRQQGLINTHIHIYYTGLINIYKDAEDLLKLKINNEVTDKLT
jgi:lipopolysaccharide biosynthesis protein